MQFCNSPSELVSYYRSHCAVDNTLISSACITLRLTRVVTVGDDSGYFRLGAPFAPRVLAMHNRLPGIGGRLCSAIRLSRQR